MVLHIFALLACAITLYLACEFFVNAVEWLGVRLNMGTLAIGTILAAIGTALPESIVTLVAVTMRHGISSKDIGVGAAMGGPLALATIAYGVSGFMLLRNKRGAHPLRGVDLSQLPKYALVSPAVPASHGTGYISAVSVAFSVCGGGGEG